MEKEFEKRIDTYIYIYIYEKHFAVHVKQHNIVTTMLQYKIKIKKKKKKLSEGTL